jgi:hypothetical protein
VLVFAQNCLFQEVLDRFGIKNAWRGETTFWGSVSVGIDRLAAYRADVICFDHGNAGDGATDGDAAVAGDAVCARRALPARSGGVVLWRDAVGDAFCPRAGRCSGRPGMIAYFAFGDILLTLLVAAALSCSTSTALPRRVAAGAVAAGYR